MLTVETRALTTTGSHTAIEIPVQTRPRRPLLASLGAALRSLPAALGTTRADVRVELDEAEVTRGAAVTGRVRVIHRGSAWSLGELEIRVLGLGMQTILRETIEVDHTGLAPDQEISVPFSVDIPEHVTPTWALAHEHDETEGMLDMGYQVVARTRIKGARRSASASLKIR